MKVTEQEIISNEFERKYPSIASWTEDGIIEIGHARWGDSFVKVIDEGGLVWEGKRKYASMDDALNETEKAITKWMDENM